MPDVTIWYMTVTISNNKELLQYVRQTLIPRTDEHLLGVLVGCDEDFPYWVDTQILTRSFLILAWVKQREEEIVDKGKTRFSNPFSVYDDPSIMSAITHSSLSMMEVLRSGYRMREKTIRTRPEARPMLKAAGLVLYLTSRPWSRIPLLDSAFLWLLGSHWALWHALLRPTLDQIEGGRRKPFSVLVERFDVHSELLEQHLRGLETMETEAEPIGKGQNNAWLHLKHVELPEGKRHSDLQFEIGVSEGLSILLNDYFPFDGGFILLRDEETGTYWFCPPKGLAEAVRKILDWCGKENIDEMTYVSSRFLRSLLVQPVKGSPSYYQRYSPQAIKSAFQSAGFEPRKHQEDTQGYTRDKGR